MASWFRGFRLKMLTLIGLGTGFLIALSIFANVELNKFGAKLDVANLDRVPLTQGTNIMAADLHAIARYLWSGIVLTDKEENKIMANKVMEHIKDFETQQAVVDKLKNNEFTKKKLAEIDAAWPALKEAVVKVHDLMALDTKESEEEASKLMVTMVRPTMAKVTAPINELNEFRTKLIEKVAQDDAQELNQSQTILLISSILACILMFTIGFIIASRIARVLNGTIENLSHHSKEVSSASAGLSSAASSLSTGATETASSLEETVASTEELNSMVRTNADNARQAAALAREGQETAQSGQGNITSLHEAVGEVSKASKQIEEIISVIDDIAFQTNLLALNAAVEAARAGEQGKGFAVVAEAVRNLAQRSAVAAKDIAKLISESVGKIENSRELAEMSKDSLGKIVEAIQKVSDINAEIATASEEQASGLANISKAMNEIDRATQQNASSSEEISATSEQMTSQSVSLQDLVRELVQMVEGTTDVQSTPNSKPSTVKVEAKPKKPAASNVVPMRPKSSGVKAAKQELEDLLPMESDLSQRKVSKVEGF